MPASHFNSRLLLAPKPGRGVGGERLVNRSRARHCHGVLFWLLSAAARASAVAREILLAAVFGAAAGKDALVAASAVPTILAGLWTETFTPLLTPLWAARNPAETRGARRLVGAATALLLGLAAMAALLPAATLRAAAPGLAPASFVIALPLIRWFALNLAFLGAQALLGAWWNARQGFLGLPAAALLASAAVLAALLCSRGWPVAPRLLLLAIATTVGNAVATAALALAAARARAALPVPPLHTVPPAPTHWRTLGAVFAALAVLSLAPLADRRAASGLAVGSLAALDYGERLVRLVFTLALAPFTVTAFTRLSRISAPQSFGRALEAGLCRLLTTIAPLAASLGCLARLWTRCLFGFGRFHADSVATTAPVVAVLGTALGLEAVIYFLSFGLFAGRRAAARWPLAVVLASVNVGLVFPAAARFGISGIATAHVAANAAGCLWLWRRQPRDFPAFRLGVAAYAGARAALCAWAVALPAAWLVPVAIRTGQGAWLASCLWLAFSLAATCGIPWLWARRSSLRLVTPPWRLREAIH